MLIFTQALSTCTFQVILSCHNTILHHTWLNLIVDGDIAPLSIIWCVLPKYVLVSRSVLLLAFCIWHVDIVNSLVTCVFDCTYPPKILFKIIMDVVSIFSLTFIYWS